MAAPTATSPRSSASVVTEGYSYAQSILLDTDAGLTPFDALWIGGAGAVAVRMIDGTDVVFSGVLAGTLLRVRGTQVRTTGTTVATPTTVIRALWA